MNMKLRNNSTQPRIFEGSDYEHPWYKHLKKPNPPTPEQIEKAQFVDKTYEWRTPRIRS
jgi:hypothetical protein